MNYRLFGLRYEAGAPLPALPEYGHGGNPDVVVELDRGASRRFRGIGSGDIEDPPVIGATGLAVENLPDGDHLILRFPDRVEFILDSQGTRIVSGWGDNSSPEDAAVYLLASVSGILLRLRGITALHACAVLSPVGALLFIGQSEAGKSTTAAAFARMGLPVLTDDIAALATVRDKVVVHPGAPRVLLWPEAVEGLWGSRDALPPLVAGWDKRWLDLPAAGAFHDASETVAAVYLLGERSRDGPVRIEPVTGAGVMPALVSNVYMGEYFERERRAADFALLSMLARNAPLRRVFRPDDLRLLPSTCEAVLRDAERIVRERNGNLAVHV